MQIDDSFGDKVNARLAVPLEVISKFSGASPVSFQAQLGIGGLCNKNKKWVY